MDAICEPRQVLPEFVGLELLPVDAQEGLRKLHEGLVSLAARDRGRLFEYGKFFLEVRELIMRHAQERGVAGYCEAMAVSRSSFYEAIKIYEMFEERSDLLRLFPLTIQRQLARNNGQSETLLAEALRVADAGQEVTQGVLDSIIGIPTSKPPASLPLPPVLQEEGDEEAGGEEEDEVWDDEDVISIPRGSSPPEAARPRSIADAISDRDALCAEAIAWVQDFKKGATNWIVRNKVITGSWWALMEAGLDSIVEGAKQCRESQLKLRE